MNTTNHTPDTIRKGFILGLKGIFRQSKFLKDPFDSVCLNTGLAIAVIVTIFILCFKLDLYSYINEVQNLIIQLVPCLLGFTIAGYSFLMGFIQPKLMERISEPSPEDETITLYQSISSSLALNILLHSIILIIAYLIHIVIFLHDKNPTFIIECRVVAKYAKIIGLFIANICLFGALAVVVQIIVSSFNLSQLNHYDFIKEKLEKEKKT